MPKIAMTHNLKRIIQVIYVTLGLLLSPTFSAAQDTISLRFHKTVNGCLIQGPMKENSHYYVSKGYNFPLYTSQCGNVPEIRLDSIDNLNSNFSGYILGKWYWISDCSDSLYMTNLVEVKDRKIVSETRKMYQFYFLSSEVYISDTVEMFIEYNSDGTISRKQVLTQPKEIVIGDRIEICSNIWYSYNDLGLISERLCFCGDDEFVDIYEYEYENHVVIHYLIKNGVFNDIFNVHSQFVNRKGKLMSKSSFINALERNKIKSWSHFLLDEKDWTDCFNSLVYEDGFEVWNERKFGPLKKKIKCAKTN